MALRIDPYICTKCSKTFTTMGGSTAHVKRGVLCRGQKIMLQSEYRRLLRDQMELAVPTQSPPVPPSDNANPNSASLRPNAESNTAPGAQDKSSADPLPVSQLDLSLLNPHSLEPSFVLDSSSFDPPAFDPLAFDPLAFDPLVFNPLVFDPSAFDPSVFNPPASNLFGFGQEVEPEMEPSGPGPFWNPWAETVGGAQHNLATHDLLAPSAQVDSVEESGNIRHRLPSGQPYVRIVSKGRVIYRHPTAGQSYGKGRTRWEAEREKNATLREGNQWAMWRDKDEWETAKWMATTKTSQSSLNKLLKTERYRDTNYSFKTAKRLFKKIRDDMGGFGGPEWNVADVVLDGTDTRDKVTLFFRDPQEGGDFLFGRPQFAGKMSFAPEVHYDTKEAERLFGNPWTADAWNERQHNLPPGTTHGGLYFASNATQLSMHSGDVAAHAVYMTLANLDKSTRASVSENAWILVAYIPKSKFKYTMSKFEHRPKTVRTKLLGVLNRRLFHRCMSIITRSLRRTEPHDVIDPEGNIRSVLYEMAAYIADLEEQWLISGLGGSTCPHCACDPDHLGNAECSPPRNPSDILRTIKQIKRDYRTAYGRSPSLEEFMNLSGKHHLNGVDKPFWRSLPKFNIFEALSPDLLHGFHKFFYDHIYKFNLTGMSRLEYDARVHSQPRFSGDRSFLHGVSHISQMTGMEHRMLERTHLAIVANAPGVINAKVTRATHGIMDCIYLAQLPTHTECSLQAYKTAYEDFMANRQGWIENETRRGKREVIPHFHIPKMHITRHFVQHVRQKGSADNFTTETMEHLHIGVKEAYRASNRREWKQQTVRWLTQRERIRDFEAWLVWCEESANRENSSLAEDGNEEGAGREVNPDDGSDNLSVDDLSVDDLSVNTPAVEVEEGGVEEGEGEFEEEGVGLGPEGESEFDDLDEYGDQLADKEGGQEEMGKAGVGRVRGWLGQIGAVSWQREEGRKRKRRVDSDDQNPRSVPRPRLQVTHGLSSLQKVNREPTTRRQSFQQICQLYNLDLDQLMHEVGRNDYVKNLPIIVDEYAEIDTWDSLRTHLQSTAYRSGAKMQRIRAKPATRAHAAKNDPILYVNSEREANRAVKLHDCSIGQARLIFRLTPTTLVPEPPLMVYVCGFSKIPRSAGKTTGLRSVKKLDGRRQHRITLASDILRLCPLAPVMRGRALRDVDCDNVFDRYDDFYLNKYRNIDDFMFMYSDDL